MKKRILVVVLITIIILFTQPYKKNKLPSKAVHKQEYNPVNLPNETEDPEGPLLSNRLLLSMPEL